MKKIAEILVQTGAVQVNFEEPFTWTSGIKSPIYCDCRELISFPVERNIITTAMTDQISAENIPVAAVAGTATAGIPWAAFVAQDLGAPMLYVRSKPKGHGAGKMVEGKLETGKHILVVEDALSTAGSSIQSVNALRQELAAHVAHIFAVFSWDTPAAKISAEKANVQLHPLTTFGEIIETLVAQNAISEDQKIELEHFRENPSGWWQKH